MKLIELLSEDNITVSNTDLLRQKYKENDLKRTPSPTGEGNRLSPLTIPIDKIIFDRAIGPNGGKRKDGSKKQPKDEYTTTDYTLAPVGNPIKPTPASS